MRRRPTYDQQEQAPNPATVVADAGYWSKDNVSTRGVEAIIAPGKARKLGEFTESE